MRENGRSFLFLLIILLWSRNVNSTAVLALVMEQQATDTHHAFKFDDNGEPQFLLMDRESIQERISTLSPEGLQIDAMFSTATAETDIHNKQASDLVLCSDLRKEQIKDSITRVLNFYEEHIDTLDVTDYAFGLSILKSIDEKHNGRFQELHPISQWISFICDQLKDKESATFCHAFNFAIQARPANVWQHNNLLEVMSDMFVTDVGKEKDPIWPDLNYKCLEAIVVRCEVPQVCERVMFDSNPGSQYMLSHQVLFRMLAETSNCLKDKTKLVDKNTYNQMCGKMFAEAKLLAATNQISELTLFRDLFSEQVAFCGYLGYPNFFNVEWLDQILSWQSESQFGCFLEVSSDKFESSDRPIQRKLTVTEQKSGILSSGESCGRHLTSVALAALAMYFDYTETNCE